MEKRPFGNTGETISMLGLGGFHLLEISDSDASSLIKRYLDNGGNYIETAAAYGGGESERKIGLSLGKRRDDCFLATKCIFRDRAGAQKSIDESLQRLKTDHVDLLFLHNVKTHQEYEEIFGPDGAFEAFKEAKQMGKTRYLGITGHGVPEVLIRAVRERDELDVLMTVFNFFDRFNYPDVEDVLLPEAKKKGMAVVGMKSLADGLLWETSEAAIRYSLSLPIDVLATGFNTPALLEQDLSVVSPLVKMSRQEKDEIFATNKVLGSYVCRQCGKCLPCPENIDIPKIALFEGWYDRQLRDWEIRPMPEFALRDRLRYWFEDRERARSAYEQLPVKADACTKCGECIPRCPYNIDIIKKLEYSEYKLTREVASQIYF